MNQELWEQLEGYQDLADSAGVGDEWRTLCVEKTQTAAFAMLKKTTTVTFTADVTAPTPVQVTTATGAANNYLVTFEDATSWIISAISANAACLVQAVAAFRENGRQE